MKKDIAKLTRKSNPAGRQYSNRGDSTLAKFTSSNGSVYGTVVLDTRRLAEDGKQPVAVRVAFDKKVIYLRIGKRYTKDEWMELCEYEKAARQKKQMERKEIRGHMDKVESIVNQLINEGAFSLARLQERFSGISSNARTIYSVWEAYIKQKSDEGSFGTARTSTDVYRRFLKHVGKNVAFADIDKSLIVKWTKVMKEHGLNGTTIALSLRMFRVIVNICITEGLIKGDTRVMFKDTGYNKSNSRKHEFLDVATWRLLYDFWEKGEAVDENGNELFMPQQKEAIFRDLGLLIFMYLGDGQNLADTLRLTYDEWYFATHGKQMRFLRHKTRERNESASEVIFPITPELQKILDRHASEPKLGARVFPIMPEGISGEKELWTVQRYNRYIRQHMQDVAKILGLEQRPTPTWARHSFATNLNNSGRVPYKYISDSMGHSGNGDITSNYIGAYPLEKMLEYNHYLLNEDNKPTAGSLIEQLKSLTEEERKAILAALM